jgi:methionyl-tRNA formyltransferase
MRIIFMGTPGFAVASLDKLVKAGYNIVAVITAPDKPAGRGRQLQESAVKEYAKKAGLNILQPINLKDEGFIDELKKLKVDLQIVVAFRMLPEKVWNMPPLGTFNLHASLLPQYRGAAPINHAIIKGEKETGVSTFFLKHDIDTGNIIFQEKVKIGENETAGELHDKLMQIGSELVLRTVRAIEDGDIKDVPQEEIINNPLLLKHAPKIFKEDCRIIWNKSVEEVYNHIRGLSPYPAAFTELVDEKGKELTMKIFRCNKEISEHSYPPGAIISDNQTIKAAAKGGFVIINELQLEGKKRLKAEEFIKGYKLPKSFKV